MTTATLPTLQKGIKERTPYPPNRHNSTFQSCTLYRKVSSSDKHQAHGAKRQLNCAMNPFEWVKLKTSNDHNVKNTRAFRDDSKLVGKNSFNAVNGNESRTNEKKKQKSSCVDGIFIVKITSEIIFYLFIYLSSCAHHLCTSSPYTTLNQSIQRVIQMRKLTMFRAIRVTGTACYKFISPIQFRDL